MRYRLNTKEQRIEARTIGLPTDAVMSAYPASNAVVYRYNDNKSRPCARGFFGTASRPSIAFYFASDVAREERISKWLESCAQSVAGKAERKQAIAARIEASLPAFEVGVIVYSSWGYDQTNVEFYQITRRVSAKVVEVRELEQERTASTDMSGNCVPRRDVFLPSKPMTCRIGRQGLKVGSHSYAGLWDGLPKYWSSYA